MFEAKVALQDLPSRDEENVSEMVGKVLAVKALQKPTVSPDNGGKARSKSRIVLGSSFESRNDPESSYCILVATL